MAVTKRLRNTGHGTPVPLFTGGGRTQRAGVPANMGSSDVRGNLKTRVITLQSYGGTDEFKIRVDFRSAERTDQLTAGKEASTVETVAFVRGTNGTAVAIQAALRTATGDSSLTVTGTTDAGPFTVVQGDTTSAARAGYEFSLVDLVGCSGSVSSGAVTYSSSRGLPGDDHDGGTDTGVATASSPGRGAGFTVPLGQSIVTKGVGQTAQATLVRVAIDAAVGGDDQVVITGTEDASGGTSAVAGYAIYETLTDNPHSVIYTEDADADVTITGLTTATDYYVIGFTQSQEGSADFPAQHERVSRGTDPTYFTTT